ncbi:MAG: dTDP-4-dehydrorhamnose reductase [Clostridia bacterium]|nr:dTDP-4-dehydrorhamnose reductase [Clostridia bacterium]
MEKILVTGVGGQLGRDVVLELESRGIPCKGVDLADFDLTDKAQTDRYIRTFQPTAVIHCAAYTNVNAAEENEELCRKVNVEGTQNIAEACRYLKCKLIYISSDYVFDGSGDAPRNVDDPTGPLNAYGKSKLDGEAAARINPQTFVVRTSWVYGYNGNNFVKTMMQLGRQKTELTVVADQIGSPTYTKDLAKLLADMVQTTKYGTYHATNEGFCSWAEFAAAIMKEAGIACRIVPVYSAAFPSPAKRPLNSRLSKISLDFASFQRLPDWHNALSRYLIELSQSE